MSLGTPEAIVEAFRAAWMARDGTAIGALFAEDADFVNVVGIWWEKRDAISNAHSYALESFFAKTKLVIGRVKVRDLGDVAVVHARAILTGQITPNGTTAGPRTTILSFVMVRQTEGWLCVSAQNTDIVPGRETHLRTVRGLDAVDYR